VIRLTRGSWPTSCARITPTSTPCSRARTRPQELKLLTDDYQRQVRQQTRLVNQLTTTLKAYYPRGLEVAELTTALAREFLRAYPTPEALTALTERQWQRWARAHRLHEARTRELWAVLQRPQLPVLPHVVRAKARLMQSLVAQLTLAVEVVGAYREAIEDLFAHIPAAQWIRTLPIGDHGITAPTLWARLGDAPGRWESFRHLQAQAGTVPVTIRKARIEADRVPSRRESWRKSTRSAAGSSGSSSQLTKHRVASSGATLGQLGVEVLVG
jgi:hypothetical protein